MKTAPFPFSAYSKYISGVGEGDVNNEDFHAKKACDYLKDAIEVCYEISHYHMSLNIDSVRCAEMC